MAYSETWANLKNIAGATPSNQIDDKFRARFLGVEERMNEIFVDFTTDPVVLKDSILGKVTGKVLVIPHNMFTERVSVGSLLADRSEGFTHAPKDAGVMDAPIMLPPGVTITRVETLIQIGAGVSITWEVFDFDFRISPAPVKSTLIGPTVFSTAGFQFLDSGVVALTIDGQHTYYISLDVTSVSGDVNIYGTRITYNTPSSQQTI